MALTTQIPAAGASPFTVNIDPALFENAIETQGVHLLHYRSFRCPVGMVELHDGRRVHPDHVGCHHGFVFREVGKIAALFTGNDEQQTSTDSGWVDGSTAQSTLQRFYEDSRDEPYIAIYDRFYSCNEAMLVPTQELFHSAATGRERLSFPVVRVEEFMDADGNEYVCGTDFDVQGGYIVWSGGRRPRQDPETRKGVICSARYLYRPYWNCARLMHQIRFAQVFDPITGKRELVRMPQACVLVREYAFREDSIDPLNPDNPQAGPAPHTGSFGGTGAG